MIHGIVEKVMVSTNHNIPRSIWVAVLQITEYLLVSVSIDKSFHFSLCSKLILFYCVVVAGKCEDCTSSTVI